MIRTFFVWLAVVCTTLLSVVLFEDYPWAVVWGSTIAWNIMAPLFFLYALLVYLRSRRELAALGESGNGRTVVARGRLIISEWFLNGAALGMLTGWIGAYRLTIDNLNSPLALLTGSATRDCIVIMFFCFFMAKLTNWDLYDRAREFYLKRGPKGDPGVRGPRGERGPRGSRGPRGEPGRG